MLSFIATMYIPCPILSRSIRIAKTEKLVLGQSISALDLRAADITNLSRHLLPKAASPSQQRNIWLFVRICLLNLRN